MKVLVIGSSGFIGQALVSRLLAEGHEVEAWDRREGEARPGLTLRTVDLLGPAPLPLPEGRPWEAAFHLAAHAVPGVTWTRDLVMQNLAMTARAFDHLAEHAPGCRAIFASSAFVYAPTPDPVREDAPLGSIHPYALSKQLGEAWALSHRNDLRVFIVPSGRIWNLCSGRATPVAELVHAVLDAMHLSTEVCFADPAQEALVGDPTRLMGDTGWSPRRSLRDTVAAILRVSPGTATSP